MPRKIGINDLDRYVQILYTEMAFQTEYKSINNLNWYNVIKLEDMITYFIKIILYVFLK
jgi:hypothetical protein